MIFFAKSFLILVKPFADLCVTQSVIRIDIHGLLWISEICETLFGTIAIFSCDLLLIVMFIAVVFIILPVADLDVVVLVVDAVFKVGGRP